MRSAPDPPRSAPRILITTPPHYLCLTTLPHHFCLTTSPHAADYTKQPVFDEGAILSGLSPSLHNEVVRSILAETVGRLPLFSSKLSPEFQMAIFPKLKPVSYEPGQTIFDKGAVSQELLFVLHGEVDVHNRNGERFMKISASEVAMIDHVSGHTLVSLSTTAGGCFGQSVLVGRRREAKHVAFTPCEVWTISKEDLRELFSSYPNAARLICTQVLRDYVRFDRLRLLAVKMAIALEADKKKRSLLRYALQWKERTAICVMEHDLLYRVIVEADKGDDRVKTLDGIRGPYSVGAGSAATGAAMGAATGAGTGAAGSPAEAEPAFIRHRAHGGNSPPDTAQLLQMIVALGAKVDRLVAAAESPNSGRSWRPLTSAR